MAPEPGEIPFPEMPRQYQLQRSVPDHELLIVFRGDDEAIAFAEWFGEEGWGAFNEWYAYRE